MSEHQRGSDEHAPLDDVSAGSRSGLLVDPHRILAGAEPATWAPAFFGVVPAGSIRRRPSDALHLAIAVVVVARLSTSPERSSRRSATSVTSLEEATTKRSSSGVSRLSSLKSLLDAASDGLR